MDPDFSKKIIFSNAANVSMNTVINKVATINSSDDEI